MYGLDCQLPLNDNMPDTNVIMVLTVAVTAMALFISGKLRVDLVALCVLVALVLLDFIETSEALYGFANLATATMTAMFVLSAGLVRTGLVQWLAYQIDQLAGKSELRLLLVLCIAIAFLSAFIVNTATVAIFIPVAIVLTNARRIAPFRMLMPLSFTSQFGGVCTLIGTSTNILVNAIGIIQWQRKKQTFSCSHRRLVSTRKKPKHGDLLGSQNPSNAIS